MSARALGSVVIPAHNEVSLVGRALAAIEPVALAGHVEVTVACNGCTDGTPEEARRFGWATVIEVPVASKVEALRAADRATSALPRVYLDADIVLPAEALALLLRTLRSGEYLAARPPLSYDTRGAGPVVRAYYRARERVPLLTTSLWGAGVYGLSERGRARFGEFPDVTADDLFVAQLFSSSEFIVLECPPVSVVTPQRVTDLLRVLRRTYRGQSELGARASAAATSSTSTTLRQLFGTAQSSPAAFVDAVVYVALTLLGRLGARLVRSATWESDRAPATH
jgi:glycosyltransferase involved in cell wall biosynthesis